MLHSGQEMMKQLLLCQEKLQFSWQDVADFDTPKEIGEDPVKLREKTEVLQC